VGGGGARAGRQKDDDDELGDAEEKSRQMMMRMVPPLHLRGQVIMFIILWGAFNLSQTEWLQLYSNYLVLLGKDEVG
jgi:hypothetical protein